MKHVHLPFTPEWLIWPIPWVWALLLLLLLPLLWLYWQRRAQRPAIRYSSLGPLRAAGGQWSRRMHLVLPLLRTAALACLIIAVARPQKADDSSHVFAEGVAIQMVVDTSSSMEDADLAPRGTSKTRLDVVKDVFRRFVSGDDKLPGRKNDLIGMVRFARYADSTCPLTLDYNNLLSVLAATDLTRVREEDGTAIGDGLALAVERFKDLKRKTGSGEQLTIKSRVVVLLTDGENNAGNISPQQAGELAATYGIRVYTILAGTGQRVPFGRLPVNDEDLKRIAEVTGGKFYQVRDAGALARVCEEIDKLERTKVEERRYMRFGELSLRPLLAAFVLLGLQTLLDATRLRRIPA